MGNAIISRYPLADISNVLLPRLPSTKQRSLLGVALAAGPAAGLMAFATHLDHAFEGTRLVQMREILRRIAHDGPHFLAGDFNTPGFRGPHMRQLLTPVLRSLRGAGYRDAFAAVGEGSGRTFPAHSPFVRIDFLFFPCRWSHGLRSARTLGSLDAHAASDHRPVIVEWAWPDAAMLATGC